jgi:hypoxanthine phosphoribosyltransferase
MTITEYENSVGELMVLVIDEVANTGESMPKAEYERQQAEQSTPIVIDEAKTK